jgi:hypothetical protein
MLDEYDIPLTLYSDKAIITLEYRVCFPGTLWAGKGSEKSLDGQFGATIAADISRALQATRGDRCGRFWVDLEAREIRMAVGDSAENKHSTASF